MLVAAFDSQVKWAAALEAVLSARGLRCRTLLPTDVRHALSPTQAEDLRRGVGAVEPTSWAGAVATAAGADVVVVALSGPSVRRFTHDLDEATGTGTGPVVVTGWMGVVIERPVEGYVERAAADVVAVGSRSDLHLFRQAATERGLPTGTLLLSGMPLLPAEPAALRHDGEPRTVLFADQPTVPASRAEREHLYLRLLEHARRHPEQRVRLKPRHRLGEDTYHRVQHHPEEVLAGHELPANFTVDHTPVSDQLPGTDLLLTVSSTAAVEAVAAGVRAVLLSDLGVRADLGNRAWASSGLLGTFEDVDAGRLPSPRREWLDDLFPAAGGARPAERIVDRALALVDDPGAREGAEALAVLRQSRAYRADAARPPESEVVYRGQALATWLKSVLRRRAPRAAERLEHLAVRLWPRGGARR